VFSCGSQKSKETKQQLKDSSIVVTNKSATVDTLFMDFFEEFMWNKEFQKSRIVFPYKQGNKTILSSQNWKHLPFYTESEYIPILNSDTVRLFDIDVKTNSIGLFIVNFERTDVTCYNFKKVENKWFLLSSENLKIENTPDFEFIDFLKKYSNDSVFQINHTVFPLSESYADSEKDYETANTTINLKDWKHVKLVDFADKLVVLSNIEINNNYRNIFYRGVENGIWVKFTFEKINNDWKLIRLEDYST
jgi:hypothetical protein